MTDSNDVAFNKIMELAGDTGRFQNTFNTIFNIFLIIFASMSYMNVILALNVPDHWCTVPQPNHTNLTESEWKQITLPLKIDNRGEYSLSSCLMYNITDQHLLMDGRDWNFSNHDTVACQHGWTYDKEYYDSTIPTEQDWVCEKELYVTNTFVLNRIGEVIGTFIFGHLGDTLGRRFVYYFSLFTVIGGRMLSLLTTSNFYLFALAAVIGSFASNFLFQSPLIIALEISKPEDRAFISMLQALSWSVGMCVMTLIYWLTRDWKLFLLWSTLPGLVFLLFSKYMIESPRWLINRGQFKKALVQLKTIARINRKTFNFDETFLKKKLGQHEPEMLYGVMSLFSSRRLAKNTILILVCWVTGAVSYFTLALNSSRMGNDPFLSFFFQSLIEIPAYIGAKYLGNTIGRRFTTTGAFLFGMVANVLQIFFVTDIQYETIATILAVCIKFFITITFFSVNLISMETYPTCLRQTGISLGSVIGNAVGVVGPYIVYLGTNVDIRYPYIIMAIFCLVAMAAGLFLPETLYQKLPETLAEAQVFGSDHPFWSLPKQPKESEEDSAEMQQLNPI